MAEAPQPDGLLSPRAGCPAPSADISLESALRELAYNLHWAWNTQAQQVFEALSPEMWQQSQNPVLVLDAVRQSPTLLAQHADAILSAHRELQTYLRRSPDVGPSPRVAYFSAEFAVAECLPIYSGGLGVLAADHLKSCSDLGVPLIAVGLLYRYGYFHQTIDATGYQREVYDRLDPARVPLTRELRPDGSPYLIGIPFPGRTVYAHVWRAQVGRVPLFLLDTELEENRWDDRRITGHLYGGDQDTRIRQEIVLGIGGVRLLRQVLGPTEQPDVFHMNEGHSAFLALELAREQLVSKQATDVDDALVQLAPHVAFTTHTPVPAGHDAFPAALVEAYLDEYWGELGLASLDAFMALGRREPEAYVDRFNMTILALRAASRRNAVSQLHGRVSEKMWADVGVGLRGAPPAVPMGAITNGVHTATWIGPDVARLLDDYSGPTWRRHPDDPGTWDALRRGPIEDVWRARTTQRARLLRRVEAMSHAERLGGLAPGVTPERTLVFGFARRFATYKRAALLLRHPERLAELLGRDTDRPMVIIFAGKAHPRDDAGKLLVQQIVEAAQGPRFKGHLVFLENYDVEIARFMVQGSDVWLNTPRRPQEASGTSGMKAVLNGALHLSELDGWWDEAYDPALGWALGENVSDELPSEEQDAAESLQLVETLENKVVPLFFSRRQDDATPLGWMNHVMRSITTLAPQFSAHRMVREYVERVYQPAGMHMTRGAVEQAVRANVAPPG